MCKETDGVLVRHEREDGCEHENTEDEDGEDYGDYRSGLRVCICIYIYIYDYALSLESKSPITLNPSARN